MRQALHLTGRTAILALGAALSVAGQTPAPAAKPATQAPAKPATAPATQSPAPAKTQAPAKPAATAKTPAAPKPAAKPVQVVPKPKPVVPAKKETKKETPKPAKPAVAAEKKTEAAPAPVVATHRRDPFVALVSMSVGSGPAIALPPGPGGLQVSTLRVQGVVRSPNGMLAVVTNPQGRTYFLHQGARVFDGKVEQISMDAVTFQETGKDPFGKTIDRTVVKRIYASAGEP